MLDTIGWTTVVQYSIRCNKEWFVCVYVCVCMWVPLFLYVSMCSTMTMCHNVPYTTVLLYMWYREPIPLACFLVSTVRNANNRQKQKRFLGSSMCVCVCVYECTLVCFLSLSLPLLCSLLTL